MIDVRPAIHCVFVVLMGALMPLRKRGAFGTPDEPIYFEAEDTVPWWIECRWPIHMDLTFGVDVETYYEDGEQIVRTLEDCGDNPVVVCGRVEGWLVQITGAPTTFVNMPRRRPRSRVRQLKLAKSFG